MTEKIVETKNCKHCGVVFIITDKDREFYDKISPVFSWKKYKIPNPTLCPDCRQQRRLSRRNERKLYKRNCDASGKQIISIYSPDKKVKVYHYNEWRSDKMNAMEYWMTIDFNKSFFVQFEELLHLVPRISAYNRNTENTEYGNNLVGDKNCYMLFITYANEDCYYGHTVSECKNCVDMLRTVANQNCYTCVNVHKSYECFHCMDCNECVDGHYLIDCFNVRSSRFCIGLREKKYHFLNTQYSEDEFTTIVSKLKNDHEFMKKTKADFDALKMQIPVRDCVINQSEHCSWDYLDNCKDCHSSFNFMVAEDAKYCYDCFGLLKSMDIYLWWNESPETPSQLLYECENSFNVFQIWFCSTVTYASSNILYSDNCEACKNCFWCVWLRHKEYCILNTQYTKEEYEKLVPQIIKKMESDGQRWEFFPASISLFWYNETEAQVYYPMTKQEVEAKWRKRYDDNAYKIMEWTWIIHAKDLPDTIEKVDNTILDKVILCEITGKPFRIIKQELEFYRKYDIALPRRCPDQRHLDSIKHKHPRKLRKRTCMKCWVDIQTTYAPESQETVYCEKCYNTYIYW